MNIIEMDAYFIDKLNNTELPFNDSCEFQANFSFRNCSLSVVESHDPAPYFGEYLIEFRNEYLAVHGYLSVILSVFGIASNVLNIIVLTRKTMISSTNAILTGLAVADLLVMISYLPYAYYTFIAVRKNGYSKEWAIFIIFHTHFTAVNHTISTWLTVTVAIWRYLAIKFPLNSARWCSMHRAMLVITATYITSALFYIPNYLSFTVSELNCTNNEAGYKIDFSEISQRHNQLLEKMIFWHYSVFTKFIPCVALTALSLCLIHALNEANKIRQILKKTTETDRSHGRTTKMLLAVVLLFLLTQLPTGLIVLLTTILGLEFYNNVFLNFLEITDILMLINSAINFIIYCSMCRKFRETFICLFIPKCIIKPKVVQKANPPKTDSTLCV